MNIDIFQVNKLCQQAYQIISPLIKNTFKKLSTETEIVYIHKNLQLIIDKSGNKKCYEFASKEVKNINDKFIIYRDIKGEGNWKTTLDISKILDDKIDDDFIMTYISIYIDDFKFIKKPWYKKIFK